MSVVKLTIYVPSIAQVIALFDKIQVQRSKLGSPYTDAELITAAVATAPVVTGTGVAPFADLRGRDLKLEVDDGVMQEVWFNSANPISMANAIGEFNNEITGATASDDGDHHLVITGDTTGTAGIVEVVEGEALSVLGLSACRVNGLDAYITLVPATDAYVYEDRSGENTYWYRERYLNTVSGTFGGWSSWVQGSVGEALPEADLIVGNIKLADIDGTVLVGAKVTIINVYNPYSKDGFFIAGRSKEIETDDTGQASCSFVKGSTVDVLIGGTSVVRRILVPSTGTEFDIMDEDLVQDDPWQIQVPDLPAAPRSS